MYNGQHNSNQTSGPSSGSHQHSDTNQTFHAQMLLQQLSLDEQQRLIDQAQARVAMQRLQLQEIARRQVVEEQARKLEAEIAAGEEAKRRLSILNQARNRPAVMQAHVDPRQLALTYEPTPSTSNIVPVDDDKRSHWGSPPSVATQPSSQPVVANPNVTSYMQHNNSTYRSQASAQSSMSYQPRPPAPAQQPLHSTQQWPQQPIQQKYSTMPAQQSSSYVPPGHIPYHQGSQATDQPQLRPRNMAQEGHSHQVHPSSLSQSGQAPSSIPKTSSSSLAHQTPPQTISIPNDNQRPTTPILTPAPVPAVMKNLAQNAGATVPMLVSQIQSQKNADGRTSGAIPNFTKPQSDVSARSSNAPSTQGQAPVSNTHAGLPTQDEIHAVRQKTMRLPEVDDLRVKALYKHAELWVKGAKPGMIENIPHTGLYVRCHEPEKYSIGHIVDGNYIMLSPLDWLKVIKAAKLPVSHASSSRNVNTTSSTAFTTNPYLPTTHSSQRIQPASSTTHYLPNPPHPPPPVNQSTPSAFNFHKPATNSSPAAPASGATIVAVHPVASASTSTVPALSTPWANRSSSSLVNALNQVGTLKSPSTPDASKSRSASSLVTPSRTPKEADKKTLARDIMNALGYMSSQPKKNQKRSREGTSEVDSRITKRQALSDLPLSATQPAVSERMPLISSTEPVVLQPVPHAFHYYHHPSSTTGLLASSASGQSAPPPSALPVGIVPTTSQPPPPPPATATVRPPPDNVTFQPPATAVVQPSPATPTDPHPPTAFVEPSQPIATLHPLPATTPVQPLPPNAATVKNSQATPSPPLAAVSTPSSPRAVKPSKSDQTAVAGPSVIQATMVPPSNLIFSKPYTPFSHKPVSVPVQHNVTSAIANSRSETALTKSASPSRPVVGASDRESSQVVTVPPNKELPPLFLPDLPDEPETLARSPPASSVVDEESSLYPAESDTANDSEADIGLQSTEKDEVMARDRKRSRVIVEIPPPADWIKRDLERLKNEHGREFIEISDSDEEREVEEDVRIPDRPVLEKTVRADLGEEPVVFAPVRDPQEVVEVKKSITRLRSVPCQWGDCEVVLNSLEKLAKHLRIHVVDSQQKMGRHGHSILCKICGRHQAHVPEHVENHAYQTLICPYKGCELEFRSSRKLHQHCISHENDVTKPSADLLALLPSSAPDTPPTLPSYMVVARAVRPHPISKERHQVLGPWILKNMMPPVDAVSLKRHLRAKHLGRGGTPSALDEYDFLLTRSSPSCLPSRPAKIRDFVDLNSEQVSQLVIDGMSFWEKEGTDEENLKEEERGNEPVPSLHAPPNENNSGRSTDELILRGGMEVS